MQLWIIGLDDTGLAIGLALRSTSWASDRIGFDSDIDRLQEAHQIEAIDRWTQDLDRVANADLILLNPPTGRSAESVAALAPHMKPGSILLDLSRFHNQPIDAIAGQLSEGRTYLSAAPLPGASGSFRGGPNPDAFRDGLLAIVAPAGTPKVAVDIALELAHALGAAPFFTTADEFDGMQAAIEGLPLLTAAALMHTTAASPAWRDLRRTASAALASATLGAKLTGPDELVDVLVRQAPHLRPRLDQLLEELTVLRAALDSGDKEALQKRLAEAADARRAWLEGDLPTDWEAGTSGPPDLPSSSFLRSLLGLAPKREPDAPEPPSET